MSNETTRSLAEALRGSGQGAREQIEYLPIALIDPDPDNFYSLDGLEELADSIATVGLIDPIRVRPNGERYTVTSGHRRRAAILLLIDSGEDHWREAVPCIVDRGETTPEFAELKLIYANSASRRLSSAEISRQAERVEELLVALKQKGFAFPGRMQDHVAQAMSVTSSKLKRLHAIRANAHEYVLDAYDQGKINESVAYELQQLSKEDQSLFMRTYLKRGAWLGCLTAGNVEDFSLLGKKLRNLKCKVTPGTVCSYGAQRLEVAYDRKTRFLDGRCRDGHCCLGCPEIRTCEDCCPKCHYAQQEAQHNHEIAAQERERQIEERNERISASQAAREAESTAIWMRVRKAAEKSGQPLHEALAQVFEDEDDLHDAMEFTEGRDVDASGWISDVIDCSLPELSDALHCSADFLLGRTEETAINTGAPVSELDTPPAPAWRTGDPEEPGEYLVWAYFSEWEPDYDFKYWQPGGFWAEGPLSIGPCVDHVLAWAPLPPKAGAPGRPDREEARE